MLASAYMRAMKDPFPPARQAGILAMAATHNYFTLAESAQKLLPALCSLTTDPDKGVRDQACSHLCCTVTLLVYTRQAVVKVDRRIRWHYTTTILRLRTGARLTRYQNCKFHNFARTISRHADGISRYSVPPSAGPLLPL